MSFKAILSRLNRRDLPLLPRFTRPVLLVLIVITVTFFAVGSYAAATTFKDKQDAIKEGGNQEAWLDESLTSNMVAMQKNLTGYIPDDILDGTTTSFIPGGAFGTTSNLIGVLFTPQASGIEYLAQTFNNFLGKPAYAQSGAGFSGLSAILPIWRAFRNVVYILSSFIFIIIGLMIMLRVKISPQAVISIQSAIPQLITTLILVTFSYAIAGLLIDFMMLIQAVTVAILFSAYSKNLSDGLLTTGFVSQLLHWIAGSNAYDFASLTAHNGFVQTYSLINRAIPATTIMLLSGAIGAIIGGILGLSGGPVSIVGGAIIGGGGVGIVVLLIIEIIVIANMIKLLFGLLKVYVNVIIKIILAPLEIGLGAFPNSKAGFNTWIIDLIANLCVFPFVIIFLILLNLIVDGIGSGLWTPPLLGAAGIFTSAIIKGLVGVAGFLLVAKLPEMVPQFVFMLKPSPWGQAIGEGLTGLGGNAEKLGVGAAQYYSNKQKESITAPGMVPGALGYDALKRQGTFWDIFSAVSGKIKR